MDVKMLRQAGRPEEGDWISGIPTGNSHDSGKVAQDEDGRYCTDRLSEDTDRRQCVST